MVLSGHQEEILTSRFHPDGDTLATAGVDKKIFLWNVYGECNNFACFSGHKNAVLEICFTSGGKSLVSCSVDKTLILWDYETGSLLRRYKAHKQIINSCSANKRCEQLIVSGSDDRTIKIWDNRSRDPVFDIREDYQVLSVCFSIFGDRVISAGIENKIKIWDIRNITVTDELQAHTDSVTGLKISPDESFLISNGMDNRMFLWDIRPFVTSNRCLKAFFGHSHNFEQNLLRCAYSNDGKFVAAASSDRNVHIWSTTPSNLYYRIPGHEATVNDVDFHPKESIVLSCGSDKNVYLGEIQFPF